jgi:hypothetical protein
VTIGVKVVQRAHQGDGIQSSGNFRAGEYPQAAATVIRHDAQNSVVRTAVARMRRVVRVQAERRMNVDRTMSV